MSDEVRDSLVAAARRIINELATTAADDTSLSAARDLVEQAARAMEAGRHDLRGRVSEASLIERDHFLDYSPFTGRLSPLAPPIRLRRTAAGAEGDVVFPAPYEGPPTSVHGGMIAGAFDELLGFVVAMSEHPGMTGRLTIHYRSPTPLMTPVRFTASVVRHEGRKTWAAGELRVVADGRLCAEAEGLFIAVDPQRLRLAREAQSRLYRDLPEPGGEPS